jgi:hypothetical protein
MDELLPGCLLALRGKRWEIVGAQSSTDGSWSTDSLAFRMGGQLGN